MERIAAFAKTLPKAKVEKAYPPAKLGAPEPGVPANGSRFAGWRAGVPANGSRFAGWRAGVPANGSRFVGWRACPERSRRVSILRPGIARMPARQILDCAGDETSAYVVENLIIRASDTAHTFQTQKFIMLRYAARFNERLRSPLTF